MTRVTYCGMCAVREGNDGTEGSPVKGSWREPLVKPLRRRGSSPSPGSPWPSSQLSSSLFSSHTGQHVSPHSTCRCPCCVPRKRCLIADKYLCLFPGSPVLPDAQPQAAEPLLTLQGKDWRWSCCKEDKCTLEGALHSALHHRPPPPRNIPNARVLGASYSLPSGSEVDAAAARSCWSPCWKQEAGKWEFV